MFAKNDLNSTDPIEFLQHINLVRLDDRLSWVEQNNAILKLIKERDQKIAIEELTR